MPFIFSSTLSLEKSLSSFLGFVWSHWISNRNCHTYWSTRRRKYIRRETSSRSVQRTLTPYSDNTSRPVQTCFWALVPWASCGGCAHGGRPQEGLMVRAARMRPLGSGHWREPGGHSTGGYWRLWNLSERRRKGGGVSSLQEITSCN